MKNGFTRFKNKKFIKERIELDGHGYERCTFEGCLIVLAKGETELKECIFNNCRLLLRGQALQIARILQTFIGNKPLKVLDFSDPGIFQEKPAANGKGGQESGSGSPAAGQNRREGIG